MKPRTRWVGILRMTCACILAVAAALSAFVQIEQRLLCWRAERLLADIRTVQMGKSTWTDAQRLMYRWGAWGGWMGSCTAQDCEYQIALRDASHTYPVFFWTQRGNTVRAAGHEYALCLHWFYWILGGRVANVYASIHVKNGIVWSKSFEVLTPRKILDEGVSDLLIGDAFGVTRFRPVGDSPGLDEHPEYSVLAAGPCDGCSGACTICAMISARFTPFADPAIIDQLFDFNLGCISSWRLCDKPSDIMPSAWPLFRQDDAAQRNGYDHWPNCDVPLEAIGRDYRYGLLTRVVSIKTVRESDGHIRYEAQLRALADLKNDPLKARLAVEKELQKVLLGWQENLLPGRVHASDIKPGDGMIFMFDELPSSDVIGVGYSPCSLIPDTDQNRAAIRRGIAKDALSDLR